MQSPNRQFSVVILPLALCLATSVAHGQLAPQGTRWFALQQWSAFAEVDVEAERDTESTSQGNHFTSDRLYLAPTAGLQLSGSVYHPNLLQFDLSGQGGYVQQTISTTQDGQKTSLTDTSFLQNYAVNATFLRNEPYSATFTATKVHSLEELDIFNQLVVDTETYGGRVGYADGPVPFSVSAQHMDEDQSGLLYDNKFSQDNFEIRASNDRKDAGSTLFNYTIGQYDEHASGYGENNFFQYGTLNDIERWGKNDRFRLTSSLFYDKEDNTNNPSENVIIQENLTARVRPNLDSFSIYNFNDDSEGPANTTANFMESGLTHKFYDSLTSELDLHGTLLNGSAPGSSSSATIYGIGNSETYVKRLGGWGRLTVGNAVRYDIENEDNSGGLTPVLGERVTVNDATYAYLSQPLVISIQQVTDSTGSRTYIEGLDYTTVTAGFLTGIRRIFSSPNLTNGASVLVNYTVESQPSGTIRTYSDQFQVRLDLYNGLLGFYSGLGWIENYTRQDFLLDNEFTTLSGADFSWRWLRAGGSYETRDSNLIEYNTLSFYQTATFDLANHSNFSLNANEQWSDYPSEHLHSADYLGTARFSQQLMRDLTVAAEAGIRNDQGGFLAQTLFAAKFDVRYKLGKFFLSLDYQFNDQSAPGEKLVRNFVSFRAKRSF